MFVIINCLEKKHVYVYENILKAPQPIDAWSGSRNATRYGSKCLQTTFNFSQFWGEEDCLFLNVYTPSESIMKRKLHLH